MLCRLGSAIASSSANPRLGQQALELGQAALPAAGADGMGGEIMGETIDNHSGRFNHDPTETAATLDEVAKVFNRYGITITGTNHVAPKPCGAMGSWRSHR